MSTSKYTPSHKMTPGYLARRFAEIRRQQAAERKAAEEQEQIARAKVCALGRKP